MGILVSEKNYNYMEEIEWRKTGDAMIQFLKICMVWFDASEYGNPVIRNNECCFQNVSFLSSLPLPSLLLSPLFLLFFSFLTFLFHFFLPFTFVTFPYPMKQLVFELKENIDPFVRFSGFNNPSDKLTAKLPFRKLLVDHSMPLW